MLSDAVGYFSTLTGIAWLEIQDFERAVCGIVRHVCTNGCDFCDLGKCTQIDGPSCKAIVRRDPVGLARKAPWRVWTIFACHGPVARMSIAEKRRFPRIDAVGLDGLLVRFGETLTEAANRAALAFRAAIEADCPAGVEECSTSLVSTYLRFDPVHLPHEDLAQTLATRLRTRDWYQAELPDGRRAHLIPTLYGNEAAPQLDEAADLAGLDRDSAVQMLSGAQMRVTAIGFAPGQPYLGTLPPQWDIPRQTGLTPKVPEGALVVAIRQFVLFSVSAPTGWRHVGQTRAPLFRLNSDQPFLLRPGDDVRFPAISASEFAGLGPDGGIHSAPVSLPGSCK